MRPHWTIPKVLEELVKRGWADQDDAAPIGVSLSRMARSGELHRQRKGVYQLPRDEGGDKYLFQITGADSG